MCKFLMDCSHFISFDENPLAFVLRPFFLPLNCAQIFFFFSIFFTMIDQLLFVFAWFVLVLTYIFSHIKLHFVCLLLRHIWVKICKNYAEFFVLLNCPTEIHSKAMERTMVEVWKRGGKVFASASKLTINLHDNWLELGCHGARRLQSITNCQPPYWINKKRIYFYVNWQIFVLRSNILACSRLPVRLLPGSVRS